MRGYKHMGNIIKFPVMTVKMEKWPNRIREWRKARRMTQAKLAGSIGLSDVMISHLETGRRPLDFVQARAIARVLGVDTVDLLAAEDNPHALDEQAKDLMRLWPHIDGSARQTVQNVAEIAAGFRAQPAILDHPAKLASDQAASDQADEAATRTGRNAA